MLPLMQVAAGNRLLLQNQQIKQRHLIQNITQNKNNLNIQNKNTNNIFNNNCKFDNFINSLKPLPFNKQNLRNLSSINIVDNFEFKNKIHDGTINCNICNYRNSLSLKTSDKKNLSKQIKKNNKVCEAVIQFNHGIKDIITHHSL